MPFDDPVPTIELNPKRQRLTRVIAVLMMTAFALVSMLVKLYYG